ncbi:MAG: hypothetical protein J2P48_09995 [Alphaproteobacteria bacterium]|nr:hypothetical protein [Alphaproteobacteria bacterium]
MESQAAERIASEIYNAMHDNVATGTDLRDLERRLKIRLGSLIIAAGGLLFAGELEAGGRANTSSRGTMITLIA